LKFSNLLLEVNSLLLRAFKESFKRPVEFKEFLRQCYNMGNRSLTCCGYRIYYWIGFTLQSRPTPKSLELFPDAFDEYFNIREIGSIITALICAGRIGSE
jgi:phospholipid/cholesterol/gamma-HCH transport system permease protein